MQTPYYLWLVKHPIGTFIGVAESEKAAIEHFGEAAEITPLTPEGVMDLRAHGDERVFLAI